MELSFLEQRLPRVASCACRFGLFCHSYSNSTTTAFLVEFGCLPMLRRTPRRPPPLECQKEVRRHKLQSQLPNRVPIHHAIPSTPPLRMPEGTNRRGMDLPRLSSVAIEATRAISLRRFLESFLARTWPSMRANSGTVRPDRLVLYHLRRSGFAVDSDIEGVDV